MSAGSGFACGNLFASSYVSVPAGSKLTSTDCAGNDTWAGSKMGMSAGLEIVNGMVASHVSMPAPAATPSAIPEPGSICLLLAGLAAMVLVGTARKAD
ncbi:PEP-CTERM sorting domain-containing protein [Massilia sp. PWRC2]|uniref:PEP-CTERM sorting domain-containing protein n=1 Tax=Massilia sp. PWRC2 TaxID=2804626 RepID=UPI003CEE0191